ncbi:hypothetical protein VZT92_023804 [Zoarces viviparus]|uniref:Uncharacterized protein n=1 Tax=Zoarces viviparus TaxID=48416 RepID=A0AAW1E8M6_ZOAVI
MKPVMGNELWPYLPDSGSGRDSPSSLPAHQLMGIFREGLADVHVLPAGLKHTVVYCPAVRGAALRRGCRGNARIPPTRGLKGPLTFSQS